MWKKGERPTTPSAAPGQTHETNGNLKCVIDSHLLVRVEHLFKAIHNGLPGDVGKVLQVDEDLIAHAGMLDGELRLVTAIIGPGCCCHHIVEH